MTIFNTIYHLQHGTPRQQQAYNVLINNNIIEKLEGYSLVLAGTIPININIESSDLDILCQYTNVQIFYKLVKTNFEQHRQFKIKQTLINGIETILANFYCNDFEIEIFGQPIPVTQQSGYLHMIAEHQILLKQGEGFRQQIIALKNAGYKTEPAFAKLLDLKGDPYEALLNYIVT